MLWNQEDLRKYFFFGMGFIYFILYVIYIRKTFHIFSPCFPLWLELAYYSPEGERKSAMGGGGGGGGGGASGHSYAQSPPPPPPPPPPLGKMVVLCANRTREGSHPCEFAHTHVHTGFAQTEQKNRPWRPCREGMRCKCRVFSSFPLPQLKSFFGSFLRPEGIPPQRPKRAPLPFLVLILARKRQSSPPPSPLSSKKRGQNF